MKKIYILFFCFVILMSSDLMAQCFNMSTVNAPGITCTYGSTSNPYAYTGILSNRHVVILNQNGYDPIVSALRLIPVGETSSVRLGNSNTGAEAESITYEYLVDEDTPILLLKYAAVLEDPGHSSVEQPRLTMEIMNSSGTRIDPECTYFDFVANANLGWNAVSGGRVLWKDWTNVGIDLTPYKGERIRVRMTTYDCSQSAHFGYAYIHLSCAKKQIHAQACSAENMTFSAPAGFNYKWYTMSGNTKVQRGSGQTLTVPMDNQEYFCDISQLGKPNCSFTTSVIAIPRFPIADFSIQKRTACVDTLYLENISGMSRDGVHKNMPLEPCEMAQWDLGDGRVLNSYQLKNTPITYRNGGLKTITLRSYIDGTCYDEKSIQVYVHGSDDLHESLTTAAICDGEEYYFGGKNYNKSGLYEYHTRTPYGCDSLAVLNLVVNPAYHYFDTTILCQNDRFLWHGQEIQHAGNYIDANVSINGCDSTYELHVIGAPTYYEEQNIDICEGEFYELAGRKLFHSGIYYDSTYTILGCDSVTKLTLNVHPKYVNIENVRTCYLEEFYYRGQLVDHPGIYDDTLKTIYGCDSIIRLNYVVNPTYQFRYEDTYIDGGIYEWRGRELTEAGVYWDSLTTQFGCDSIYKLTLTRAETYLFSDTIVQCGEIPYTWRGKVYNTSGVYYDRYKSIAGADSVYVLYLTNYPTYRIRQKIELCAGQSIEYRGKLLYAPLVYEDTLLAENGCDSIVTLILTPASSYYFEETKYFNHGSIFQWHGKEYDHPGVYYDSLVAVNGCDSVYKLTLTEIDYFYNVETYTICENQPLDWHGHTYTESGVYYDRHTNIQGNDSVYELRLTVLPTSHTTLNVSICEGDAYLYHGIAYSRDMILKDTLINSLGCDSTVTLILHVNSMYFYDEKGVVVEGATYNWHNRELTIPGVYWDSLTTQFGCDSIYKLTLTRAETYLFSDTIVQCGEIPYTWRGKVYNTSGVYYDRYKSIAGADSVYVLYLTNYPTYRIRQKIELCAGQSIEYRGKLLYAPLVYEDTLLTENGCDSIVTLILTPASSYYFEETKYFNHGSIFQWHGKEYDHPGVYYDSLVAVNGCDSVYKLTLTEIDYFYNVETYTICENQPLDWHGHTYTESGVYYDRHTNIQGNDSVYELRLTVLPTSHTTLNVSICEGDAYLYHGIAYSRDTILKDTLINSLGCDSIVTLILHVNSMYFYDEKGVVVEGATYNWHNRELTIPGVYWDSLTTQFGCDSIYKLTLTRAETYLFSDTIVQCGEIPYTWRGKVYNTSGVYYDRYKSIAGADSVYVLYLTNYPTYRIRQKIELCAGQSIEYRGKLLYAPLVYEDTLLTENGCDSIVTLILTPASSYYFEETKYFNHGSIFQWHGKEYDHPGVYYDSLVAVNGCDSVYKLTLTEIDYFYNVETYTICENQPLDWHGHTYTESGVYYDRHTNIQGNDSVYELRLTVLPTSHTTLNVSICEGDAYLYHGIAYSRDTILKDTLINSLGCDSIVTLILHVNSMYFYDEKGVVVEGATYSWHNRELTIPGVYWDSLTTQFGCDSIYKLTLTRAETYLFSDTIVQCGEIPYTWRGKVYNTSGVYYDRYKSIAGADSVYELHLTITPNSYTLINANICEGDYYVYNGIHYESDTIIHEIFLNQYGCDSVVDVVLHRQLSYIYEEKANVFDGGSYSWHNRELTIPGVYWDSLTTQFGCDSIYKLTLTRIDNFHHIDTVVLCGEDAYYWHGRLYEKSGIYYDRYKSSLGIDSIYELQLTLHPKYVFHQQIKLCENQTFRYHGKDLSAPSIYRDTFHTIYGCDSIVELQLIATSSYFFTETAQISIGESYKWHNNFYTIPGTYYEYHKTTDGCDSIYCLKLDVKQDFYQINEISACDLYQWHGMTYTESGIYYDANKNSVGADSIYELRLTIHQCYFERRQITCCPGEEFILRGKHHRAPEVFHDTLLSIYGCDSIFEYHLVEAEDYHRVINICRSEAGLYEYDGKNYQIPGHYVDYKRTINGCEYVIELFLSLEKDTIIDSTYVVCANQLPFTCNGKVYNNLGHFTDHASIVGCGSTSINYDISIVPFYSDTIVEKRCSADPYVFDGNKYSQTGVYSVKYKSKDGCDSVYVLDLTFYDPIQITSVDIPEICANDKSIPINYSYTGTMPTKYSLHFDAAACAAGFVDVVNAAIPNPTSNTIDVLMPTSINGNFTRPDEYSFRIVLDNEGCEPIEQQVSVLVRYPISIIEQNWDDVVSVLNQKNNGGYTFQSIEWEVNGSKILGQSGYNLYLPNSLKTGDNVVAYLTRAEDNYAIPTCPLVIQPYKDVSSNPTCSNPIPSIVPRRSPITHVQVSEEMSYILFSSEGQVLYKGKVTPGAGTIQLPSCSGLYILSILSSKNEHFAYKVRVE